MKIEAVKYREFATLSDQSGNRSTYFQPVLDRLDVKPSKLDIQSECIVVEGKSDFHILSYISKNYLSSSVAIVPALGATTMRPVIAILRGWATRFLVLLDSDKEGVSAKKIYRDELDLGDQIVGVSDIDSGAKEIEDFFSQEDKTRIQAQLKLTSAVTKKSLSRLFQEANASGTKLALTKETVARLKGFLVALNKRLVSV